MSALCALALLLQPPAADPAGPLDYNRDVRPILAENCFACHGFDEKARKARIKGRRPHNERLSPRRVPAASPGFSPRFQCLTYS